MYRFCCVTGDVPRLTGWGANWKGCGLEVEGPFRGQGREPGAWVRAAPTTVSVS